ncbi:MAG: PilN domain-containing protein [Acidobacteriota bacterium]
MIRVNLYPTVAVVDHTPPQLYGVVVFAVCAAGLGYWFWDLNSEKSGLQDQTVVLQQEMQRLQQVMTEVALFEQRKEDLKARLAIIDELEANQKGPVELMNDLIAGIPANPRGLWLTNLTQQETEVTMEGRAFDVTFIADFISALESSASFSSVELEYWDQDTESTIRFRLNCVTEEAAL